MNCRKLICINQYLLIFYRNNCLLLQKFLHHKKKLQKTESIGIRPFSDVYTKVFYSIDYVGLYSLYYTFILHKYYYRVPTGIGIK